MNKTNLVLKMGLAALMASSVGSAIADTKPGQATAVIITPVTVAETTAMNFGSIAPGLASSDISVTTGNTRTLDLGDATLVGGATAVSGVFTITGPATTAVSISVADGGAGAAANDLILGATTLTFVPSAPSVATIASLAGGGADTFTVGGTLTVPTGTPAGTYTNAAAYEVTVNYQ